MNISFDILERGSASAISKATEVQKETQTVLKYVWRMWMKESMDRVEGGRVTYDSRSIRFPCVPLDISNIVRE
jgi:hypothetical protein